MGFMKTVPSHRSSLIFSWGRVSISICTHCQMMHNQVYNNTGVPPADSVAVLVEGNEIWGNDLDAADGWDGG